MLPAGLGSPTVLTGSTAASWAAMSLARMGTVSEQAGRYQRSAAGMIGAMAVLVALIVGFVVLRDLNRQVPPSPVTAVDYQASVTFARERASFDVLAPERLPSGWRATTVEFTPEPSRWHLGVLTDQKQYVGLEQAISSEEAMVTTYVDAEPTRGPDITIDGQTWSSWSDAGGDLGLVREDGAATTLVVGTAAQDVLVDYIESMG